MRIQPTKVEELDAKRPGLRQLVDLLLDALKPLEEIQERVERQFGERIAVTTLSNYKQRRWLKAKQRVQAVREHAGAIIELLGSYGISEVRRAMLYEKIQTAMDAGAELDPHFMISEERRREELDLKKQALEQEGERLRLLAKKLTAQLEEGRKAFDEAAAKTGQGKSLTVEDINRIRERVFGLPEIAPAPPA